MFSAMCCLLVGFTKRSYPEHMPGASSRGLPPFNLWRPDGTVYGVDVDLLDAAGSKLGFTFGQVVMEPVAGVPVAGSGGKEWLGVIGAVKNGTSQVRRNSTLPPNQYH